MRPITCTKHDPEAVQAALDLIGTGLSIRETARKTGIPSSTLRGHIKAGKLEDLPEELEAQNRVLKFELNRIRGERDSARDLQVFLEDFVKRSIAPITWRASPAKIPKPKRSDEAEVAMLDLSDMQIGSIVRPHEVMGLNTYNLEVFKERLQLLVEKVIHITEGLQSSRRIDTLIVNFLGDIVEGELIFEHQPFEIEADLLTQIFVAADELVGALLTFAQHFKEVKVYAVPGNHGRASKRNSPNLNFDTIVYRFIEQRLALQRNIRIYCSDGPCMGYEEPEGWLHVIQHGDNIRSYLSIPYYGLDRAASRMSALLMTQVRYYHIGHHHSAGYIPNAACTRILNGSFVGTSRFSANEMQTGDVPVQWFMGYHPKYGKTWLYDLRLDEPVTLTPDQDGILFGKRR